MSTFLDLFKDILWQAQVILLGSTSYKKVNGVSFIHGGRGRYPAVWWCGANPPSPHTFPANKPLHSGIKLDLAELHSLKTVKRPQIINIVLSIGYNWKLLLNISKDLDVHCAQLWLIVRLPVISTSQPAVSHCPGIPGYFNIDVRVTECVILVLIVCF